MRTSSAEDRKRLAIWAADCAERVLPLFERARRRDDRPRRAIEEGRTWARTGAFRMAAIRGASLDAHAAARDVKDDSAAACFAARAAGHAAATAHVADHAFGAPYYALKAVAAANPDEAGVHMTEEFRWQRRRLPRHLRPAWEEWRSRKAPAFFRKLSDAGSPAPGR